MAKRMLLVTLCAVVFMCCKNSQDEEEEKLSCYRRFLCEATAFDYCGSSYSGNDVAIAADAFAENDVRRFFLSEHGQENRSIEFFSLLYEFEKNIVGENKMLQLDTIDIDKVKDSLLRQRRSVVSSKERFSLYCYERNLMRLLYSVARVLENLQCSANDKSNFILRILPDKLFAIDLSGCDWIVCGNDVFSRLRIFRNLLLVSCHMKFSSERGGWEVQGVKNDSLKKFVESGNLHMFGKDKRWSLIFTNKRLGSFKCIRENSFFCPQITGQKTVFLSSDYSKRRTEIFRHGEKAEQGNMRVVRGKIIVE